MINTRVDPSELYLHDAIESHEGLRLEYLAKLAVQDAYQHHWLSWFKDQFTRYPGDDKVFSTAYLLLRHVGYSAQDASKRMEEFLCYAGGLQRLANVDGDAVSLRGGMIEIKFSIGSHFHYKRVRRHRSIDDFMLIGYSPDDDVVYWWSIPAPELYAIGDKFKLFEHSTTGTVQDNLKNENAERQFMLYPAAKVGTKQHHVWASFEPYRLSMNGLITKYRCGISPEPYYRPQGVFDVAS